MKSDYKITRGNNGRYSTVYIGDSGVIETVFSAMTALKGTSDAILRLLSRRSQRCMLPGISKESFFARLTLGSGACRI